VGFGRNADFHRLTRKSIAKNPALRRVFFIFIAGNFSLSARHAQEDYPHAATTTAPAHTE
jgi:hypothetical protein